MKENPYKKLVGHNVVVLPSDENREDYDLREYHVEAVSPEGSLVKFKNGRGNCFWCPANEYKIESDLGPATK